jgi:hypothetical protein
MDNIRHNIRIQTIKGVATSMTESRQISPRLVRTAASRCSTLLAIHLSRSRGRGTVVGWGIMLQAGRFCARFPMSLDFSNWHNPSSRTMALGSTQTLTEMSSRNVREGKRRPAGAYGWQPHRYLWDDCLGNVGASTSYSPMGLHDLI